MDARYGHSNFWCLYIYLNQNSLTAKFITCLTFLSPVVCIVVNFQSKKKSFGAICISWTWCYEGNKYKNFLKTMHIYKQNWSASSVIKYDCSSMIYIIYIAENIFEVRKLLKLILSVSYTIYLSNSNEIIQWVLVVVTVHVWTSKTIFGKWRRLQSTHRVIIWQTPDSVILCVHVLVYFFTTVSVIYALNISLLSK